MSPPHHFDLSVELSTLDQLLGFLAGKGYAVDFDARSVTIYGPGSRGHDADEATVDDDATVGTDEGDSDKENVGDEATVRILRPVKWWFAVIRGLQVGVRHTWEATRPMLVDEYGSLVDGVLAWQCETEELATEVFDAAVGKGEVREIRLEREYIIVE